MSVNSLVEEVACYCESEHRKWGDITACKTGSRK